jgi:hypothetical protein
MEHICRELRSDGNSMASYERKSRQTACITHPCKASMNYVSISIEYSKCIYKKHASEL